MQLGQYTEAAKDYAKGIERVLEKGNIFTTAYVLKELSESGLINELFVQALKRAQEDKDLWWQVRALQELGWESELNDLLKQNEKDIRESDNLGLRSLLAGALGESQDWLAIQKEIARQESSPYENDPKG